MGSSNCHLAPRTTRKSDKESDKVDIAATNGFQERVPFFSEPRRASRDDWTRRSSPGNGQGIETNTEKNRPMASLALSENHIPCSGL